MNRYFGTHTLGGEWHALIPRYLLLGDRVRGKRILDIGCGTGIGSSLLLEMGAESVHGVDHRPEVVDLARIKHDKIGLDFHVMLWENLEFEDDFFDAVVCLDPSSPVTDHNLLNEVRRVLKSSGEYICALERTKIVGMESLLPRYGYDSPSNQITLNQPNARVPQIGELSAHFDTLFNIVQRPRLSYLFAPENPAAESGQPLLSVDEQLLLDPETVGGVELFFCGDANLTPPAPREICLPYYNIMERLSQVVENLQSRQSLGGESSTFDEVLDAPDLGTDLRTTQEYIGTSHHYGHGLDDEPTGVRERPASPDPIRNFPSAAALFQSGELESYRDKISEHYRQIRQEIDTLQQHTRAALIERDDYINHLVQTIHARESGVHREPDPQPPVRDASVWQEETTRVFKIATLGKGGDSDALDELAELDQESTARDIAQQIASLQDERVRIDELLAAREQLLAELSPEATQAQAISTAQTAPATETPKAQTHADDGDSNGDSSPEEHLADGLAPRAGESSDTPPAPSPEDDAPPEASDPDDESHAPESDEKELDEA